MRVAHRLLSFLLLTLCLSIAAAEAPRNNDYDYYKRVPGGSDVRHEMEDFVDGVKSAMREAEQARDKREVVDLGQALHVLEHKFAGLKAAIAQEMGTRLPHTMSHSEASKELVSSSSRLLEDVGEYREDMRRLLVSMRDIQNSIRVAQDGMRKFERDVEDLKMILSHLHRKTTDLQQSHQNARMTLNDFSDIHGGRGRHRRHRWFYAILIIELVAVLLFLHVRRTAGSGKHYGKFG